MRSLGSKTLDRFNYCLGKGFTFMDRLGTIQEQDGFLARQHASRQLCSIAARTNLRAAQAFRIFSLASRASPPRSFCAATPNAIRLLPYFAMSSRACSIVTRFSAAKRRISWS